MQSQSRASVFKTMPKHDYLGILAEDNPSKKVVDFLELSKADVAKVTNVPKISIRYDERIPKEVLERLREIGIICDLVAEYFEGDLRKTALWFKLNNPALGDISPRDMIRYGRYQKLIKFIHNALAGNNP
jgi:hypothetical protein